MQQEPQFPNYGIKKSATRAWRTSDAMTIKKLLSQAPEWSVPDWADRPIETIIGENSTNITKAVMAYTVDQRINFCRFET